MRQAEGSRAAAIWAVCDVPLPGGMHTWRVARPRSKQLGAACGYMPAVLPARVFTSPPPLWLQEWQAAEADRLRHMNFESK